MPTINLTNNTTLTIAPSSADSDATLDRYLKGVVTLTAPPSLDAVANLTVKGLLESSFPIALTATGDGKFAVAGTTLDVSATIAASIGLLKEDDRDGFLKSLGIDAPADPDSGIVSFALAGTLQPGDSETVGDFTFGASVGTTVTLTSFVSAAGADTLGASFVRAVNAFTIPRDLDDLKSLPAGAFCQFDASTSVKFTASATYNFLNNPLATVALQKLPSITIQATAGATLAATVTFTGDHTITIGRLANGHLRLALCVKTTQDLLTTLTVSAGVAANVGATDALTFLLGELNPNSTDETEALRKDMPAEDWQTLSGDIKTAIDASLSSSLQASLAAGLEDTESASRVFGFEIDPDALDDAGKGALQSALTGDFTALTAGPLAGVSQFASALTVSSTHTHSLAFHLLGVFDATTIGSFIRTSKVNFLTGGKDIVLCAKTNTVVVNNLAPDKFREILAKSVTLTLPAAANTPGGPSMNICFFDRVAGPNASKLRQFVNVVNLIGGSDQPAADAALAADPRGKGSYSLFLSLSLKPDQCKLLFVGNDGNPPDWTSYTGKVCDAMSEILQGDPASAARLKLFGAGQDTWTSLKNAGAGDNVDKILKQIGATQPQEVDVFTTIWWSGAMADYAKALKNGGSLVKVGAEVVKDSNRGFNEPWMILAAWSLANRPAIVSEFR